MWSMKIKKLESMNCNIFNSLNITILQGGKNAQIANG